MTFTLATANVDKALRGDRLHRAIAAAAVADVICWQEVERTRHVRAIEALDGYETYWPSGKPQRRAVNACPISWRRDRFTLAEGGHERIGRGIAHVQPNRPAAWVLLDDRHNGDRVGIISTHTVSGLRKAARRFAQWAGRTRPQESDHELAQVAHLTRVVAEQADYVAGGGDLNRPEKIRPDVLAADACVYAAHPTHGRHWYDVIWLAGAGASHVRAIGSPSDHDVLVATVTPKASPNESSTSLGAPHQRPNKEEPGMARIDGIDLSHWQGGHIDFDRAKRAGVKFVAHKATEGTGYVDPMHDTRRRQVAAVVGGLVFGSYHFARPDASSGAVQAEHFLRHAARGRGDLRPVLDLEDHGGKSRASLTRWVRDWVRVVQKATGVPPIIYTNFGLDEHFDCPRWAARYSNAMSPPHAAAPWDAWSIWQFSNGTYGHPKSVPGVGACDINTFNAGVDVDMLTLGNPAARTEPNQSEEDDMSLIRVKVPQNEPDYKKVRKDRDGNRTWSLATALSKLLWRLNAIAADLEQLKKEK